MSSCQVYINILLLDTIQGNKTYNPIQLFKSACRNLCLIHICVFTLPSDGEVSKTALCIITGAKHFLSAFYVLGTLFHIDTM